VLRINHLDPMLRINHLDLVLRINHLDPVLRTNHLDLVLRCNHLDSVLIRYLFYNIVVHKNNIVYVERLSEFRIC
jgi:hypothetical protein